MRRLLLSVGLLLGLSVFLGCGRTTRADFPRPPASASTPDRDAPPEPEAREEARLDEEPVVEVEPEPAVEEPEPRAEEGPDRAPAIPPPSTPPVDTPLEPAPPSERARIGSMDPELVTKLARANALMSTLPKRQLSDGQRQQFAAARGFVAQAQRALDEGDERRALVLIDKCLILAEDVERSSRP